MPVQMVALEFDSLADIDDGRINRLVKLHLSRIANDVIDRPGDKNSRKVTIEFVVKPVVDQEGNCDHCKVEIECKSKLPTYRSKVYEMKVTKGGFLFNHDFPDAVDQRSIFDAE